MRYTCTCSISCKSNSFSFGRKFCTTASFKTEIQVHTGAHHQEPATTITSNSCHGVFPDRSIFSLNVPRIQILTGTNLSNQLQSQARTNVGMSTWCRHIHVRQHCFILTEAFSCRLELAYFSGKISKNRLVCKNAVALAYYGSCRLLVMSSWSITKWPNVTSSPSLQFLFIFAHGSPELRNLFFFFLIASLPLLCCQFLINDHYILDGLRSKDYNTAQSISKFHSSFLEFYFC